MTRSFRLFARSVWTLFALLFALTAQAAFTDNADGTVTDTTTGLMWDKCSWGQTNNTDCSGGSASTHTWAEALGVAVTANAMNNGAGYKNHTDWRLPNINELESLVDLSVTNPAINTTAFPSTQAGAYWSSTTYTLTLHPDWAGDVYFSSGTPSVDGKSNPAFVRLVRSGQLFDSFDSQSDFIPDAFSFTAQTGAALNTVVTSNTITVSGINSASPISIVGGTYKINNGSYTSSVGTVIIGDVADTVTVQQTSSGSYGTQTTATLTIGGVAAVFGVTTLDAPDTVPDAFSFTPQTGAALNTVATSNTITVSGIDSASPISIVGGTYKINSGSYTSSPGTVSIGDVADTVTVQRTSSGSYGTQTTATLTIGGVAGAFGVTTLGQTTYSGPTATTGSATATVSGNGGPSCNIATAGFISPGSTPAGVTFPHGLFSFTLNNCVEGNSVTIVVTYPSAVPAGAQYWKFGPTPAGNNCTGAACAVDHWYTIPATFNGNTVTFSITDGGLGDDDLTANGIIVDAGGPSNGPSNGQTLAPIPTLSEWALLGLAGLTGLLGMGAMRRRARVGR